MPLFSMKPHAVRIENSVHNSNVVEETDRSMNFIYGWNNKVGFLLGFEVGEGQRVVVFENFLVVCVGTPPPTHTHILKLVSERIFTSLCLISAFWTIIF